MKSMLSKVGFLLLLLSDAEDKASASKDTFNLDIHLEESFECFWHIMCSKDGALKIKKAADRFLDPQCQFAQKEVIPQLDEEFRLIKSIANFRSNDFWKNVLKKKACAWSKEVRDKVLIDMYTPFVKHYTEICFDEERLHQCEAVTEATGERTVETSPGVFQKVYLELEALMRATNQCKISVLKYAFP